MRFGMMAAAIAVACVSAPASAVKVIVEPTRAATILAGGTETCFLPLSRNDCRISGPQLLAELGAFEVDLPSLDGSFTLGPITYTTDEQDYFYLTPFLRFQNGTLENALIQFTYSARRNTAQTITNVFTSGFYANGQVTIVDTGEVQRGVPEPASWAMMLIGFAAMGTIMRRRRGSPWAAPAAIG